MRLITTEMFYTLIHIKEMYKIIIDLYYEKFQFQNKFSLLSS